MTEESPRDLDWPTRRWLVWGLVAVGILALIVLFFIWFGGEASDPVADEVVDEAVGPQVEWSIVLASQGGQTVTLKADEPDGAIAETWVGEAMLERGGGDRYTWDMEVGLPEPVVAIDAAPDCDALNAELDEWIEAIGQPLGEVYNWQARAFGQHALDTMTAQSCEIDESALQGL